MNEEYLPLEKARSLWEADVATRTFFGMRLVSLEPGSAIVTMVVTDSMVNGWDTCHGGIIASLADSAFAMACNSSSDLSVTVGFDIDFLEPARLGDQLWATARERAVRGRSGIYDVTVVRRDAHGDQVLAEFRGRSRTVGSKRT